MNLKIFILCTVFFASSHSAGILYPRASETREVVSLDGYWDFALDNATESGEWYKINLKSIQDIEIKKVPVPASYNDLSADAILRDYVGIVWYQRKVFPPKSWEGQKVWIRFSSVCRGAEVWVNGEWVVSHDIGHLPFQAEISTVLQYGKENTITVAVDNRLWNTTIPQGSVQELASGRIKQTYTFDFFNYAGIDRSIVLYTTPNTYIDDITISTGINGTSGIVNYSLTIQNGENTQLRITIIDKDGNYVATVASNPSVTNWHLSIPNAKFWWPYLMDPNPGYMYLMQIELLDSSGTVIDVYRQPFGIRSITWDSKSLKINNKPVYLRGFGRHEDSDIRGKGLDLPLIVRDYDLIKWTGANSYRTSHYPYAEEIMDLADELGIMIIDECPAVNTELFSDELLKNHKQSLSELIQRDKNRPSVIMWSAANEPYTQYPESEDYYRQVIGHIKSLDQSRPVTVVNYQKADVEYSAQFIDIASFNLYEGWYFACADLDLVVDQVISNAKSWNTLHNIPVFITEYGADTQEGLHILPSYVWSEEFQDELLSTYFQAFDRLRKEDFFIGEMIWNFADFKTAQTFMRGGGGNKKGIFTRNRQPKASAHLLRKRYWTLAQQLDNATLPADLNPYIAESSFIKNEL